MKTLLDRLFTLDSWPESPIKLRALHVDIGEYDQVLVGGDHIALGQWDIDELVSLGSVNMDQSEWISPRLWFPIGTKIEWKFAVGSPEGYFKYWETGINRQTVNILPLSRDYPLVIENSWR